MWWAVAMSAGMAWAAEEPELKREPGSRYPIKLFYDIGVERRCSVEVGIDLKGKPEQVTPLDCDGDLAMWATRRARKARWQKPVAEGAKAKLDLVFTAPVDEMSAPAPSYWRHREFEPCQVRLVVDPQGGVEVRTASEACTPGVSALTDLPALRQLKKRSPAVCPVTFFANVEGVVQHVDVYRCGTRMWGLVREAVISQWTWQGSDSLVPYEVLIQFNGEDAAR
jgi:hypothetical protein